MKSLRINAISEDNEASDEGGFDLNIFTQRPDDKFICPICLMVLKIPAQTICGHRFCKICITKWIQGESKRKCPVCKEDITSEKLFIDNFARREIHAQLHIYCSFKKYGCKKTFPLLSHSEHSRSCPYAHRECRKCSLFVSVKSYTDHLKNKCLNRDVECEICKSLINLNEYDSHKLECIKKMNYLSPIIVSLEDRIKQLESIVHRQQELIDKLSVNSMPNCIEISPFIWKISQFDKLRKDAISGKAQAVHSPAFYSTPTGYRMCIRLNLNGVDSSVDKYMSVFIHLVQGEFDDALSWPFKQDINETLKSRVNISAFQRPTAERNHKGFGYIEFLPLEYLKSKETQPLYVKNDVMILRINVVEE
ncbi:DgyrCDS1477 [Dimorphilus gyrociliatus]|uniref:DgyrCDS1477 n=1 Tax=Dimorphilus gyrociliatus TaxID=2664684 RepID=A0A7I8V998_9ANNE|nr:DgyrCDS1477 [Dimorphilus gyrociliatus]